MTRTQIASANRMPSLGVVEIVKLYFAPLRSIPAFLRLPGRVARLSDELHATKTYAMQLKQEMGSLEDRLTSTQQALETELQKSRAATQPALVHYSRLGIA